MKGGDFMNQTDRTYSILIVSSSRNFQEVIDAHFSESGFSPLHVVTSISAAKRKVSEYTYDMIVINSPLPDDVGTRFAIDTAMDSVVMLLVSNEVYDIRPSEAFFKGYVRHCGQLDAQCQRDS